MVKIILNCLGIILFAFCGIVPFSLFFIIKMNIFISPLGIAL